MGTATSAYRAAGGGVADQRKRAFRGACRRPRVSRVPRVLKREPHNSASRKALSRQAAALLRGPQLQSARLTLLGMPNWA